MKTNSNLSEKIISQVSRVLLGKPDVVRLATACFLAQGHLLIDDIPGVGKTTLAIAIAKAIGCDFQRIQFTSDLLPSDVLGVSVYNQKTLGFDFKPGPLFHNVILADEINRSSPKTQSALLEAMQEGQVSIDNQTHPLPKPFFVIATQNPHEFHGTFPLPESQLDRFMMRLHIGYPSGAIEKEILKDDSLGARSDTHPMSEAPTNVLDELKRVRHVAVDDSLDDYLVRIAQETRESALIDLGLSTRGALSLRRAAQGFAVTHGRDYVIPDDIKTVAPAVLAHRLRLKTVNLNGQSARTIDAVITDILDRIAVPT